MHTPRTDTARTRYYVSSCARLPASLHCTAPLSQLPNDYRPTERLRPRPPPMELSSACLPHCVPQSSSSTYTILSPSSSTADRLTHSQSFSLRAPHNIRHHRTQPHKPHHDDVVSTCDRPTARPLLLPPTDATTTPQYRLCSARAISQRWLAGWWRSRYHAQLLLYTVVGRSVGPKFPYFDIPAAAAAAVVRY